MSNVEMMERIAKTAPRLRARFVVFYYLLTILTGALLLFSHGRLAFAADLIASLCYLAVTALFYDLSRPASRSFFFLAAFFDLAAWALGKLGVHPSGRNTDSQAPHRERNLDEWQKQAGETGTAIIARY